MSGQTTTAAGFEFRRPRDLGELHDTLASAPDDVLLLGGGMTAMPYLNRGEWSTSYVVSLTAIPELSGIRVVDDALVIGATTTHTDLMTDPLVARHAAVLADAAASVGDVQVRNRGTVGGTVAFANQGADHITTLTALDATVVLTSATGTRRLPIREFITGRRTTARAQREVVQSLEVRLDPERTSVYRRLTRVQGATPVLTLVASSSAAETVLCVGGVTARPVLVDLDLAIVDAELRALVRAAVDEPTGDASSPAPYRHAMAEELATRIVQDLRDALTVKGTDR